MSELRKKRSAVLAALLTLFGGGVGFLYVGRFWWAVGLSVLPLIWFAATAWSGLLFTVVGFYVMILILVLAGIGATVVSVVFARRAGEAALRPYQRWYYYLAWYIAFAILWNPIVPHRADLFGFEPFRMPSASMRDTLLPGDFFVSNTWKYQTAQPARGELIVFRLPTKPSVMYVKRVIGLPGDVVEIKGGALRVNGVRLSEPYVNRENNVITAKEDHSYVVPPDSFFVLGDNRDHSNDSRYWGFVPKDNLRGNIEFIWFSYGRTGIRFDRIGLRDFDHRFEQE